MSPRTEQGFDVPKHPKGRGGKRASSKGRICAGTPGFWGNDKEGEARCKRVLRCRKVESEVAALKPLASQ